MAIEPSEQERIMSADMLHARDEMARLGREVIAQQGRLIRDLEAERNAYKSCLESIRDEADPVEDGLEGAQHHAALALDGWNVKECTRWRPYNWFEDGVKCPGCGHTCFDHAACQDGDTGELFPCTCSNEAHLSGLVAV